MAEADPRLVPTGCDACGLRVGALRFVPGEGGRHPKAFFVGEAPGPEEDRQGRPFVGRAGKLLRRSLVEAGWSDDEVWITNAVKYFPHDVDGTKKRIRKPTPAEVGACLRHLGDEVRMLRPRLLVALGATAAAATVGGKIGRLADLRGRVVAARPELEGVPVFVTYHPSGLHYGHATPQEFVEDLRRARSIAVEPRMPE